jgi:starch synthase
LLQKISERAEHSMRVLFVTSEFADFCKAGGLADVSAALPRALQEQGVDVRVLLPGYQKVVDGLQEMKVVASLPRRGEIEPCLLGEAKTEDGLSLYVVLSPSLYQREGSAYGTPSGTDHPDNDIRFARLSLAAAEIARGLPGLSWKPDLVHAQDWPGGLAAAYMRWDNVTTPAILTIHNLAHQGLVPADRGAALAIPDWAMGINGVEFHGQISFLKAGLYYADHVTTVSPTYAREITTQERGFGLHGLLAGLAEDGRLTGIVNGIGVDWDPARDPHLGRNFDSDDVAGKLVHKEEVRTSLCLVAADGPLFGIVSRLVHQKGMDLVAEVAPEIVRRGGQIAILGIGDPETEERLHAVARNHRDHIALLSGFNEPMAHRIMAGSDFYLMPSRFEPCGLSQSHAQRYGSIPVVHATGGLVDTVEDGETGFLFSDFTAESFIGALDRAFETYATPAELRRMRRAAMARPVAWSEPAATYVRLYARLTGKPVLRLARNRPTASALSPDLRAASVMSIL